MTLLLFVYFKSIKIFFYGASNISSGNYWGNASKDFLEDVVTKVIENLYLNKT